MFWCSWSHLRCQLRIPATFFYAVQILYCTKRSLYLSAISCHNYCKQWQALLIHLIHSHSLFLLWTHLKLVPFYPFLQVFCFHVHLQLHQNSTEACTVALMSVIFNVTWVLYITSVKYSFQWSVRSNTLEIWSFQLPSCLPNMFAEESELIADIYSF